MALEFKLPDIGEGVAEGEIVKWLVSEGDAVEEHQSVVEVMTDKATVEIPAPAKGRVARFRASPGQVVPVGSVLFELDTASSTSAPNPAPAAKTAAPKNAAGESSAANPATAAGPMRAPAGPKRILEFKLPDIGEGVAEGEVVKWLVSEGATVEEHQSIVEVMTDKATVEIPSPAAGRVREIRAKAGAVVPVGSVLFTLETSGAAAAPREASVPHTAPLASPKVAPVPAARETSVPVSAAHAQLAPGPAELEHPDVPGATPAAPRATNGRVLAVPSARRVARELGIDLAAVTGSGRNGVIRRSDVEAFAKRRATEERAPVSAVARAAVSAETRTPFRGVRRKIAEALVRSKHTAVHFTVVEELDVTDLVRLRGEAKGFAEDQGVKLTYMPFIMKAVVASLAKHPELNAKLDEEAQEIVGYRDVHLGIAVDTDQGLIVPVVRDAQQKGLLQLARELADIAERTRSGKVRPDELRGSTFSITNAGNIGGILATPIINYPDVAILGVHRIVKRPGVVESPSGDRIEVRQFMNLSLSVDHRVVDGASAARFLVHMRRLLENPGLLAL